ncbi:MAG: hypothetical protein ABJN26_17215 [Stappiaceae bacterium]
MTFAAEPGHIVDLSFTMLGAQNSVLHRAPWADETDVSSTLTPVERNLSGDFFCAPFGASDVEEAPPHGWSANGRWHPKETGAALAFELHRPVMGAKIKKRMHLSDVAPLFYQEHTIIGGEGALTVAHHPMVHCADGGRLSVSTKRLCVTPERPLEPGRGALAYPAESLDPALFPGAEGPVDLTALPIGSGTEDFVTFVEAGQRKIGWTAVLRRAEDDIVFFLKDAHMLPVTMFWHSNGGREYSPWNGRHVGVLGIEDGCAAGAAGHRAALAPNRIADTGVPTSLALRPDTAHRIAHVCGALPRPEGWERVEDIDVQADQLIIQGTNGERVTLPFEAGFFERNA